MPPQKFWGILLGIVLIFTGCQDATTLTAPTSLDPRAAATRPADDTSASPIVSPQYPAGATVIAAIGDSITYGRGGTGGGYPMILEAKLRAAGYNVVVLNEGIPGEKSPETEARFLGTIAGAKMVLLMIGMNDIVNPVACSDYSCDTIGRIDRMLRMAAISKITPLVSTVTPIRTGSYFEPFNWNVRGLNAEIYARAAAQNVVVVDNYAAILAQGGDALYSDFSVHFNDQGYAVMAQQWYDAIVNNKLIKKNE